MSLQVSESSSGMPLDRVTRQLVTRPLVSTVKVTLKAPNSFLLYSLSLGDAGIMHPKTAATNDKNPVGTGPFMFKERKEGDSITLVRAPTYRDPGSIKLDRREVTFLVPPAEQVAAK